MKMKFKGKVGAALASTALLLPAAGFGQLIIGNWDTMTDEGWIDHGNGLSITDPANTNKYSFEASMGTPGLALRIDHAGWDQNLRLNLQDHDLVDAFMTNNQIRFEFSVPAWTNNGYSGVELVLNVDGYGFHQQYDFVNEGDADNGNTNGVQYYFWNGSPQRTAVVTYNYHHVLTELESSLGGLTPGYVEILFQTNPGGGAPEYFQINDVTLLSGLPPLIPAGYSPNGVTTDATPTMEAYFDDGTETVSSNEVTMTVDGISVSNSLYYDASNSLTTISYTPVTPLEGGSMHTAKVVVASSSSGTLYTNEWSFQVLLIDTITYVDASDAAALVMASSADGPVGAGVPLVTNSTDSADGIWRARTGFGIAPGTSSLPAGIHAVATGGSGTILESTAWSDPADNTPRLKMTVSDLLDKAYNVYVYYWSDEAGSPWGIRAGFEDTDGIDSLTQVTNGIRIATDDSALLEGRQLYQSFLGIVSGTSIDVFIEDIPATDGNSRTWFDGIGYEPVGGPTLDPNINSFSIAEGNATLTWISEVGGAYSIMHKTNVNDGAWTPVKTDIPGEESTTTDSVPVSGATQEFFMIEGH